MSPAAIGALVGLAFVVAEYVLFGVLMGRAERRGETGAGPRVLDVVRRVQLVAFPLVGYVFGPILLEGPGGP